MGYSNDLRFRVIKVVEGGAAARQFVIGDATAIRWWGSAALSQIQQRVRAGRR
jgi:hypothetical protein